MTDIAKYVRIVPTVIQLLKSPFYRAELVNQFSKWRELRKEIIDTKLTIDESEVEEMMSEKILELKKEASEREQEFNFLDPKME